MNAPSNLQTIVGPDGKPAFVVIPYGDYLTQFAQAADLIPHAVVRRVLPMTFRRCAPGANILA